jgi:hypothetical protein
MDRIRFVTQGDQRILLLDFTNCTAQEVSAIADQAPAIVAQEPSGSVLVVADFSGAEFSRNAVEHIKFATVFDRVYIKRAAWVLTGNLPKAVKPAGRISNDKRLSIQDPVSRLADSQGTSPVL